MVLQSTQAWLQQALQDLGSQDAGTRAAGLIRVRQEAAGVDITVTDLTERWKCVPACVHVPC